ncbi:PepSY domain-containing protein [Metabacillus fastidiosus]|uniref:PepSY domain-containing protein n=1 Tax=Metabacillus fastidiosus TaxID=1458 RepID=A0ABU6P4E0_9BACI|nr:PepSY domain-containing protein [Metabacillus fastidiosus]
MNNKKWIWIAGVSFIVILLLAISFKWWAPSSSAETLTEEEVVKIVLEKYPGKIVKTVKADNKFEIEMKRDKGTYHLQIDAKSGEVISLELVEKVQEQPLQPKQLTEEEAKAIAASEGTLESIDLIKEKDKSYYEAIVNKNHEKITLQLDTVTGEIIHSTKKRAAIITEQEAIAIASTEAAGKIDDIDLHDNADGTPYYLVEIEPEDGDDMVVQINAYTGEVKSVTLEDNAEDLD